jgi:hypothetical protein
MRPALLLVSFLLLTSGETRADLTDLIVYPEKIELDGPRAEQRIGVLGVYAGGLRRDLSRQASFKMQTPGIVDIDEQGIARPEAEGETLLRVRVGDQSVRVPVIVTGMQAETPVSFTREIIPILTRAGCNQGACHGSQHGKGGFHLSLLGFDPSFDYQEIVQSAEGRRVVLSDPESSILLLKPTLTLEHGGGERFVVGSRSYERIRRWLEDGAPEPRRSDPHVNALRVWPPRRVMVEGEQQQILAQATWSDGKNEDVTATAQFDSLNEAVAEVTPEGLITAKGKGETHIMVRFQGQATVVQVTLPYASADQVPPPPEGNNFIDEHLARKWRELGLSPSDLCSDEVFLRRLHLDAIGTLPTPEEVKAFLADSTPDKRKKAIDAVLSKPTFVDYWALKWGDLLRINRNLLQDKGMWSFHNWVRASLRDRKPLDQMVREIVTAEGSTFTQGPANFFVASRQPTDWAETTAQLFLGVRLQCAKCHHHPFEKWSQDDYYGMTAFFVRLGTKNSQEFGLFGRERVIYLRPTGEARHPRKGGVVKPHPLDGPEMDDPFDRRRKLAEWITADDNPFFARNLVNRFWSYTMGRGLVEPVDDLRATNPPSNPELLDALAKDLIAHKYDLTHLLRTIFNSRAYQLSSQPTKHNQADTSNVFFSRYTRKRLTAEQLADALDFATQTREKYPGLPLGTRAIQLPDSQVPSYLLDVFGRPARQITCECERTSKPTIAQALHLLNSDFVNRKIDSSIGRIARLVKAKVAPEKLIEELYLVTLSRPPRAEEQARAQGWLKEAPSLREGAADLLWVLLNAREFQFNH